MLSPPSRICFPWILLTGCLMQKVTKTLWVSSFRTGISPGAQGRVHVQLVPACPLRSYVPQSSGGATHGTHSGQQPFAPFPYAFWHVPAAAEILVLYCGRRKCGKLGTTSHQYQWSELIWGSLSGLNGEEFCCIGLCPEHASTWMQTLLVCRSWILPNLIIPLLEMISASIFLLLLLGCQQPRTDFLLVHVTNLGKFARWPESENW